MSACRAYLALAGAMQALLQGLNSARLIDFLALWPSPLASRDAGPVPATVPALRWLDAVQAGTAPFAAEFVTRLAAAAAGLAWARTYDRSVASATFLENYGYCEVIGPMAPVRSSHLAAGVLLLGPRTDYPAHWHEAEELYVPLAGTAGWWQGVKPWVTYYPGEVIHHARHEPHAMRAGEGPLLALYLWRSADLAQKSRLISGSAH